MNEYVNGFPARFRRSGPCWGIARVSTATFSALALSYASVP